MINKHGIGYVEWISPEEPPAGGFFIFSRQYFFKPVPKLGGKRIELIRQCSAEHAVRSYSNVIREVDIFDEKFFDDIFWARVSNDKDEVLEFLANDEALGFVEASKKLANQIEGRSVQEYPPPATTDPLDGIIPEGGQEPSTESTEPESTENAGIRSDTD